MTDLTNWAVLRWNPINVIKKNISDVRPPAFAFRLPGTATDRTIVTTTPMNKTVDLFRARTTSSSVRIPSVSLRLTFAMEKTTAETIPMSLTSTLVLHLRSDVQSVNGNALESLLDVST